MELKKYKLGEIREIRMCKRILKSETNPYFGIPFYKIGTFGKIADAFIDPLLYKHYKKSYSFPRKGDVLISAAGTIGKSVIYNGEDAYFQDSNIVWIEHDQSIVLNEFLYYLLNSIQWIPSKGSTIFRLYNDDIRNKEVFLPSIKEQRGIVSVLSSIDRKIELNRTINQNLEAMAKQLYDYWFVQFDFPDEEGKPYKSSGGAMVWNEKLHREIPCNWDVVSLSEYLNVYSDKVSAINLDVNSKYAPIEVLPRRKMSFNECAPIENAVSGLCRFGKKHILLSNRRVYFHKVCIAAFDGVTRDTVIILSPVNKALLGYAYQIINDDVFIEYATRHSYGSEQPVLSWESAKMFKTLKPSNQLDVIYSNRICSIIDSVIRNELEIAELTKQRDELLPLLINGQVSVNSDLSAH